MITVSYNAYCAISKEGDNDIWTVRPRGVVPLLPLCSQIDVGATVNALLGDTFSRENNTHGSRFHDRDPQLASRILGAMSQSCYIGTRDIPSRVIRGPYCITMFPFLFRRFVYCHRLFVFIPVFQTKICLYANNVFYSQHFSSCKVLKWLQTRLFHSSLAIFSIFSAKYCCPHSQNIPS